MSISWASLVAQMVESLPAMWETRIQSLGQENTLEKGMATHSSILAWKTPWTPAFLPGKPHGWRIMVGYSPWGHKESDPTEQLHFHFLICSLQLNFLF